MGRGQGVPKFNVVTLISVHTSICDFISVNMFRSMTDGDFEKNLSNDKALLHKGAAPQES